VTKDIQDDDIIRDGEECQAGNAGDKLRREGPLRCTDTDRGNSIQAPQARMSNAMSELSTVQLLNSRSRTPETR